MLFQVDEDLVIGTAAGAAVGVIASAAFAAFPIERLRYDGQQIVDAGAVTSWWVDASGRKHLEEGPGRQALSCAWDDELVDDDGTWRIRGSADVLAAAKVAGKTRVAAAAEIARQAYITPGDGKAAIYALKRDEALRWQAEVDAQQTPDPADYPWIEARATRLSVTGQAVADEWLAKAAAWEAVGRQIEDAYEAAVEAVDALTDAATAEADVATIIAAIDWP